MKPRRLAILSLLGSLSCLTALGCHIEPRITVEDDLTFQLFSYELHTPYVVGSKVTIYVGRRGDDKVTGWSAESDNPSVFSIDQIEPSYDGENFTIRCSALAPGESTLRVLNSSGKVATRRTITVKLPDRIDLIPAGLIKVTGDDSPAIEQGEPIKILEGGMVTFEVAYYQGDERLFGNGALVAASADASLVPEVVQTYLFEKREWLRLSADATGLTEVGLMLGGVEVSRRTVEIVTEDQIASVEILAESSAGAKDEDILYLFARAYDADMNDLWGVRFAWALDGSAEQGEGDLYYYYFLKDAERVVSASAGGHSDEVVVFMSGGHVTDSNISLGCSSSGGSEGLLILLVVLILFALGRLRIRQGGGN
ncbi:MAG: hypothetical protein RBU30_20120 [Polyangia bacterium]|jgi:hypothetical protein|nr:hypothetical protein [Polyangia bacterium]